MNPVLLGSIIFGLWVLLSLVVGATVAMGIYRFGELLLIDSDDDGGDDDDYPSEHGDGEIDDRWPWRGP
jgi:hypothetical protein